MQFGIITILKCYKILKLPRLYIERYQVSLRDCDVRGIMLFYIGDLVAAARGLTQLIIVGTHRVSRAHFPNWST
jgi:hypothetical protein